MRLRYREAALADVRTYIAGYEEGFYSLYRDSGIWSEEIILDNVRQSAQALLEEIYDAIDARLSGTRVLGGKKTQGWKELRMRTGNRFIIAYYSEDMHIRWVESIAIDRHSIIF